ncbi:hypothetical protein [Actinoplanes sp. NPDC023714]|uniref:alpha/beta hydrolase family protein n=1 Tax=Actinoplanes sp. NPDC023714 TaxID=3154322 RepID=UPI0033D1C71A
MLTNLRRTAAAVALVTVAALGLAAPAVAAPVFSLPQPTGPFAVGRDVLHLVDRSRHDPWVPAEPRELMVSMYYPATGSFGARDPYLTAEESRLFLEDRQLAGVVDAQALAATRTHTRAAAPARPGRYPLVVLSPGFTLHRHTQSVLAEELAGHGYIVASVDHAYESAGTAFPGGRTLTCVACEVAAVADVAGNRAADISFVLDRLTAAKPAWRRAARIDSGRIGVAGHSIGGNAAATTMAADRRVRAGVNMDGTFFSDVPVTGLGGRPFLMLGKPSHSPGGTDTSWDRAWQRLDGWKRWLTVTGTAHLDFSDIAVLAEQAGLPDPESPLSGARTASLMRAYVLAFFEQHLRGVPQRLLDGPVAENPEVVFAGGDSAHLARGRSRA